MIDDNVETSQVSLNRICGDLALRRRTLPPVACMARHTGSTLQELS